MLQPLFYDDWLVTTTIDYVTVIGNSSQIVALPEVVFFMSKSCGVHGLAVAAVLTHAGTGKERQSANIDVTGKHEHFAEKTLFVPHHSSPGTRSVTFVAFPPREIELCTCTTQYCISSTVSSKSSSTY